jgi:O-antigen ligase
MRTYLFFLMYPGALFLVIYAWKDWFPAVCGLLLMAAAIPNPEMPREVLGITGLNIWNLVLLCIVPAWIAGRRREGLRWDLPPPAAALLAVYVLVMAVGFLRLAIAPAPVNLKASQLVGEDLINPLKFLVPALLVFDGARTRSRLHLALASILGIYVFLSVLVLREMSLADMRGAESLSVLGLRGVVGVTGLHRNAVSVMLAGASWALLAVRPLAASRLRSAALVGLAGLVLIAQALTGGRGGYVAWIGVGLVLGLLRWRGTLVLVPIVLSAVLAAVPAVRERALYGISDADEDERPTGPAGEAGPIDSYRLSAGRLEVWPYMVAKIGESPLVGFGRLGYQRSGLYAFLRSQVDATFPHPHNAYIEWLLDNGWLGMAPMVVLYGLVLVLSLILFRDSRHPLFVAVGGVAFALVFAYLIGSTTGRSWYPTEETVGMWAAVGLMLRIWVERSRGSDGSSDAAREVPPGVDRPVRPTRDGTTPAT